MKLDLIEDNMDDATITAHARAVAQCLTYNDDIHQAEAKHLLRELAHRIDSGNIRAHKKTDGLLLINALGKSRYATLKERLAYKLFGSLPRRL